jgi:hypothetical protein
MSDDLLEPPELPPIDPSDADIGEDTDSDVEIGEEIEPVEVEERNPDAEIGGENTDDQTDQERSEQTEQVETDQLNDTAAQAPEQLNQGEWVTSMRDVSVADLPDIKDIHSKEDFRDVSEETMRTGIARLQEMKPLIESGEGANSDYWYNIDQQRGLGPTDGYQSVYSAFYGNDRIHLVKDNDQYDISNGLHRIWVAKQMNIDTLPAEVVERRKE